MKKLEVSEEFVLQSHASACSEWKRRIEKEFPSLFKETFIVGKWYYIKLYGDEFMFQKTRENSDMVFGFNRGEWREPGVDYWSWRGGDKRVRFATNTEIESMLWKEAENRGIGEDTKINSVEHVSYELYINDGTYNVGYFEHDDLLANKNGVVYYMGQWATPLDENNEIKETISRLEKELQELKGKLK